MSSKNDNNRIRIQKDIATIMNARLATGGMFVDGIFIKNKHVLASIAVRDFLVAHGCENVPEVLLWEK